MLGEMKCERMHEGKKALLLTRTDQRNEAELYICALPFLVPFQPLQHPHNGQTWASNGSMIPAASRLDNAKSVTTALIGPKTIVLRLDG
jgi:hypothetical protein